MEVIADLHLHSRYSRAVSQQMVIPEIAKWAGKKGIDLVGTGDWTHPLWFRELKENLEEAGDGIFILKKSVRGGCAIIGEINLGGSIEPVHNAVTIAEISIEKGATSLLMPVTCRKQLIDLSDDMATKIDIQFYSDARDALLKAIIE